MQPNKYPVEYQGRTLYLSDATADLKKTYCRWLEPRYVYRAYLQTQAPGLDDDMRRHAVAEHRMAQQEVNSGGIYWTTEPCMAVATSMLSPDGLLFFNRLLLGDSAKVRMPDGTVRDWTDAELQAFLDAKDPERKGKLPVTDYQVAMDAIWENEAPKVQTGPPPSPAPAATAGSSPPSPPATSDSTATTPVA